MALALFVGSQSSCQAPTCSPTTGRLASLHGQRRLVGRMVSVGMYLVHRLIGLPELQGHCNPVHPDTLGPGAVQMHETLNHYRVTCGREGTCVKLHLEGQARGLVGPFPPRRL